MQANIRSNFAQVPLTGALAQAPDELLGAVPLDAWSATNLLSANARWGSCYAKGCQALFCSAPC